MRSVGVATARQEPFLKCPACGAEMPLSGGWGPVGDKRFVCSGCGEITDLVIRV